MNRKYLVQHFFEEHGKYLGFRLIAGEKGLSRRIQTGEVQRPGLSLAGYLKGFQPNRLLVMGRQEAEYLKDCESHIKKSRLEAILTKATPAVVIARGGKPLKELLSLCNENGIPVFSSHFSATALLSEISFFLLEEFCPTVTLHGVLVEVFGIGMIIQGESSIGKSEAALGLIERGHRLVSDDVIRVKRKEKSSLVGVGPELTRHLMEIRGIGIINVANLYGAVCVRPDKDIDIVVKLEAWDDQHFYDRVGLDEKFIDILGLSVPFHLLPVKPGRDVVLLLETIALNHRLKEMGYNSAKEFNAKLLERILGKRRSLGEARP
ncbi:MAG TPA: HPr(Ser) kinase/phosphatase [Chlamydiales bacterium]|nr:MAG: HPr(Ser) kinase/phosphatase [Verrucomicrobia bacterium RIFCSPHIGHO2_12_FULL_41_10]HLB52378.1 HPr(Ser) kinase/phosphatase [Chlamydiales bacterium]